MHLQKLTWQSFDIHNLDSRVLKGLKRIYYNFVTAGLIDKRLNSMLDSLKGDLIYIKKFLENNKQALFQIENFNVEEGINYFSLIIDAIENEDWDNLTLEELFMLPAEIEMIFDESGLIDLFRE